MDMIQIWPHGENFTDNAAFESLYYRSFPANELRELSELMVDRSGAVEFIALYEEGIFTGFMTLLITRKIAHIIYFAIEDALRGRGCGSRALSAAAERYPDRRIIVDVERPVDTAPNRPEREKRMAFYIHNGYAETEVRYNWRGEDYVILSCGGPVTEQDWNDFWQELNEVPNLELF